MANALRPFPLAGTAPVLELLIVIFLILLNGFFALSEMALMTSRKLRLKQMAQESRGAQVALALAEHPDNLLSTVQIGITLIGILAGVFGGDAIGEMIASWLADGMARMISEHFKSLEIHAEPVGGLALVVTLFILARVFRHGAAMRDDLIGTV